VPTDKNGNITYIYVYLYGYSFGCSSESACNLVNNGDFEQNFYLPDGKGDIGLACGWQAGNSESPELFCFGCNGAR